MTSMTVEVDGHTVGVSSLDRVLRERPVTLHRYLEGVGGPHCFQTRTPPHPPCVRTVTLSYPRTGKSSEAPVVDGTAALVWAVNLTGDSA